MICECYRDEKNFLGEVGTCWGTAERDACSCGGDKSKCDFYPSVQEEEKKPVTKYDRLIRKTPEELAQWIAGQDTCPPGSCQHMYDDVDCSECWLDFLKQEAEE